MYVMRKAGKDGMFETAYYVTLLVLNPIVPGVLLLAAILIPKKGGKW